MLNERQIDNLAGRMAAGLRVMGAVLLVAVLTALVLPAKAAEPATVTTPQVTTDVVDRKATLSWTAPTLYTNGETITETLTYGIYEGSCSLATLPKVTTTTALTLVRTVPGAGAYCWEVTASTPNGGESAHSARGSKTFPDPRPNAPPTLVVQ